MEIREVWAALRVAWWLPLLGLVIGALGGLGASVVQQPIYTAQLQIFVATQGSATNDLYTGFLISQQRVASYVRLLSGEQLAQRVVERLDLEESPQALAGQITASADDDTALIDVEVTDRSPQDAERIASAVGEEFPAFVTELEDSETGSLVRVTVTDQPEVPSAPSAPLTPRNVILGGLVGLLIGAGLAALRARLDRTVKTPDEASQSAGVPSLGMVIRDAGLENRHVLDRVLSNRAAEDFRRLRTNLQFLNVDEPPKVMMITSAMPAEGKTTVAINLALMLADAGHTVTLVEADLRRPKVTRYLGMVAGAGLTNVLAGTAAVDDVLQSHGRGISVLAAGPTPPNPGELLASSQMLALLDKLKAANDFVLVDAPPVLPVADATALAVHTDGALLCVRYGKTHREQVHQASVALTRLGVQVFGTILTNVSSKAEVASAYGYGYEYRSDTKRGRA